MAHAIMLKHRESGVIRRGYYGFSWTTLFFGMVPALFRGDFLTFIGAFVVLALIGLITFGIGIVIASLAWAFMYNQWYTRRLLEQGYQFNDSPSVVAEAAAKLGVALPAPVLATVAPPSGAAAA